MATLRVLIFALFSACASSAAVFVVTSTADSGPGSLRESITLANNTVGADIIQFSLPGSGVHTIALETTLPDLTSPVTIDGFSQPGSHANTLDWDSDAQLLVRLDGVKLTNGFPNALVLKANGCVVRGLIVVRFSYGIKIDSAGNNTIAGNWIGLDWDGVARGMTFDGITVTGLGLSAAGFNTIGGSNPGDRNIVSGNRVGVTFFPTSAGNNSVINNFFGTDARGRLPRGNTFESVSIQSAPNILVSRNVLCAGGGNGISILGGSGCVVQNNLIGLGASSWAALGNSGNGVQVQGASRVVIGGVNGGNIIGFNRSHGVLLLGCSDVNVTHNHIGTGSGDFEPFGNIGSGVYLQGSDTNHVANNSIFFNDEAGVKIFSGIANEITANQIYDNAGLGIDLGGDGRTVNDSGDADTGPNELQNYPDLLNATVGAGTLVVEGFVDTHPSTAYRVDFYASDSWDPLWITEGRVFLGSKAVITDPLGTATFQFSAPLQPWGSDTMITATATDPLGNTSEFSVGIPVVSPPAPPSLQLSISGQGLTVSWPLEASGYDLQSTASLGSDESWTTVTSGIIQTPANFSYTVADTSAALSEYFRLKRR